MIQICAQVQVKNFFVTIIVSERTAYCLLMNGVCYFIQQIDTAQVSVVTTNAEATFNFLDRKTEGGISCNVQVIIHIYGDSCSDQLFINYLCIGNSTGGVVNVHKCKEAYKCCR